MGSDFPEDWWKRPGVHNLLTSILVQPAADHAAMAQRELSGALLCVAHVHGLVRALDKFVGKKRPFQGISQAVALHAWLFHLGGGANANLAPPPCLTRADGADRSKRVQKAAALASDAFFKRRGNLDFRRRGGCKSASDELAALRSCPYDFEPLSCGSISCKVASAQTKGAAPGGNDTDPSMQQRDERRA